MNEGASWTRDLSILVAVKTLPLTTRPRSRQKAQQLWKVSKAAKPPSYQKRSSNLGYKVKSLCLLTFIDGGTMVFILYIFLLSFVHSKNTHLFLSLHLRKWQHPVPDRFPYHLLFLLSWQCCKKIKSPTSFTHIPWQLTTIASQATVTTKVLWL